MKNVLWVLKLLLVFSFLIIGLWFFDYVKNADQDLNIQNTTTTKRLGEDVINQVYTTPISYVVNDERSVLIDLTNMNVFLLNKGKVYKNIKVLHKGPSNLWFQSPTNYFSIGVKYTLLKSGIVNVYMPYSVQIHQDFFIHGIPYFPSGERVNSRYSGGCLRVTDNDAKTIYDFSKTGDKIIVFETAIKNENIRIGFYNPIDSNRYWIRQDFNSPLKINGQYLQHAGIDMSTKEQENVKAIYDGKVESVIVMGGSDFGFGNTVILKHNIDGKELYSLYAHLETIDKNLFVNKEIKGGTILGVTGASGYGCQNYWRIGKDGCDENDFLDRHLHFEIKTKPILTNSEGGNICVQKNNELGPCFGYVPKNPLDYGYFNPVEILTKSKSE